MIMNQDEITINGQKYKRVDNEKWIEERYVRVPDNIHFTRGGDLLFNNDQQVLYELRGNYGVLAARPHRVSDETRYLVPCDRSDLDLGDVALRLYSWENVEDWASKLFRYSCILDEKISAFCDRTDVLCVGRNDSTDWYRVMTRQEIQDMEAER
jgi:hypothetical protein